MKWSASLFLITKDRLKHLSPHTRRDQNLLFVMNHNRRIAAGDRYWEGGSPNPTRKQKRVPLLRKGIDGNIHLLRGKHKGLANEAPRSYLQFLVSKAVIPVTQKQLAGKVLRAISKKGGSQ